MMVDVDVDVFGECRTYCRFQIDGDDVIRQTSLTSQVVHRDRRDAVLTRTDSTGDADVRVSDEKNSALLADATNRASASAGARACTNSHPPATLENQRTRSQWLARRAADVIAPHDAFLASPVFLFPTPNGIRRAVSATNYRPDALAQTCNECINASGALRDTKSSASWRESYSTHSDAPSVD